MTDKTRVKEVLLEDLEDLQDICRRTFKDTYDDDTAREDMKNYLSTAFSKEQLTKELEDPDSIFYFLYYDDKLAGYTKINVFDAQTDEVNPNGLQVERLYILPKFKRKGLGKLLLENATDLAKDLNKEVIWLGVWEKNYAAKKFYKSLGFEKVGEHVFVMGEDEQIDHLMSKKL